MRANVLPIREQIATAAVSSRAERRWVAMAEDLELSFGGQRILDRVTFSLEARRSVLLRGDNGAGKTTLLNVLSGYIRPDRGRVRLCLKGREFDLSTSDPVEIARAGVGRLWQDIRLFPTMTATENVMVATPRFAHRGMVTTTVAWPGVRRSEEHARKRALENLAAVGMADRAMSSADKLSVGQMKRVAIARLLQSDAEVWLLDEPLAGLDQHSASEFISLLDRLRRDTGRTLVIIEHQHEQVAPVCDETWYLENGSLTVRSHQ